MAAIPGVDVELVDHMVSAAPALADADQSGVCRGDHQPTIGYAGRSVLLVPSRAELFVRGRNR